MEVEVLDQVFCAHTCFVLFKCFIVFLFHYSVNV